MRDSSAQQNPSSSIAANGDNARSRRSEPGRSRGRGSARGSRGRHRGRGGSTSHQDSSESMMIYNTIESQNRTRPSHKSSHHERKQAAPSTAQLPNVATTDVSITNPAILAATVHTKEAETDHTDAASDAGSEELCFICAEPVIFYAVSGCNHRTCHLCSLRLRALYKSKHCAHCRTEQQEVIFTEDPDKRYEDYTPNDLPFSDEKLHISFETEQMKRETLLLLRYNCPHPTCDVACEGKWKELKKHVKMVHDRFLCDLCIQNKKIFAHEHTLFTYQQLHIHTKFGDKGLVETDLSGFKGHPECGFCKLSFYGDDELYTHCRDKHEQCHICTRQGGESRHQYYANYDALEKHFKSEHHLCPHRRCLEQKFVVFDNELDLKAHLVEQHNEAFSTREMKDARKLDLNFNYSDNAGTRPQRDGRGGPRREGGIASNVNRDVGDPSRAGRRTGFGAALSDATPSLPQARTSSPGNNRATAGPMRISNQSEDAFPSLGILQPDHLAKQSSKPAPTLVNSSSNPETVDRHNAFLNRVSAYLRNNSSKMARFRAAVGSYRSSNITGSELVEILWNMFDQSLDMVGKIVTGLVDLLESDVLKTRLLQTWKDFRVERTSFPSLTPISLPSSASASASRVLVIKSSGTGRTTARLPNNSVWERVEQAATKGRTRATAPSSAVHTVRSGTSNTAWASSSASKPTENPSSITGNPTTKRSQLTFVNAGLGGSAPASGASSDSDFPSLPSKAPRPRLVNMSRGPSSDRFQPWTPGTASPDDELAEDLAAIAAAEEQEQEQQKGRKKKQGKGKTVLFYSG